MSVEGAGGALITPKERPLQAVRRRSLGARRRCNAGLALAILVVASPALAQAPARESAVPKRLVFSADEAFGRRLHGPTGVWCDTQHHEILVADTGNHRIVVFDEEGRPKAEIVHRVKISPDAPPAEGQPRSVATDSAGDLFVADNLTQYVDVCDYRGRSIQRIDLRKCLQQAAAPGARPATIKDEEVKPVAVTVDYRDNLYVATSCRIFTFDARGDFRRVLGGLGKEPGTFQAITGLWVDTSGKIYVTDGQSWAVQVLTPEGHSIVAFGQHEEGLMDFTLPIAIATDRRGHLWVADALRHIASVFELQGSQVKFLDYIGTFGVGPGKFSYPSGLSASLNGYLAVVDRVGGRLQYFQM